MSKVSFFVKELVVNGVKKYKDQVVKAYSIEEAIKALIEDAHNYKRVYGGVADLSNWVIFRGNTGNRIYTFDT